MIRNEGFRSKIATVLLFSFVLLILLVPLKSPFNYYDEGFPVFNATSIMSGGLPYKDFWAIYPPGQFYALAVIFKVFGTTLLAARVYDTIVRFLIVIGIYLIAKKITSYLLVLLACMTTGLLLASVGFYTYAVFPSLALSLFSILCLLKYPYTGQRRWVLLAGLLIGIASLFRWDIALYTGISVVSTLILSRFLMPAQESRMSIVKELLTTSELVILVLGGALAIALPCYGYVGLNSGFGNLWTQVIAFPATGLRRMRWLPYPALIPLRDEIKQIFAFPINLSAFRSAYWDILWWLRFYLPLAVYGIALYYWVGSLLRGCMTITIWYVGQTAVTIFGLLLFAQALSRYDYIHVLPTLIISFLVITSLGDHFVPNIRNRVIKSVFLVLLVPIITVYLVSPIYSLWSFMKNYPPFECYSYLKRASCVYVGRDEEQAVEYIKTHTKKGEPIFVGNRRHDLIFINDIGFYFLANRPSATSYQHLHPGVATTLPVQKVIANDIESKNVTWIVLVNVGKPNEPNASNVSSGVYYLDDYIRSRYAPVVEFGSYQILKRVTKISVPNCGLRLALCADGQRRRRSRPLG
jgi:hypothetical protein